MAKVLTLVMLIFVSMAGWMFGADTGSIGGITSMRDFQQRYADRYDPATDTYSYSSARQGLLVGMVNTGTFVGCILSSPLADRFGKKKCIMGWTIVYLIGVIVQLTTIPSWIQFMVAKIWTGLGIGALSVIAPGYQSESSPPHIRGAIVTTYQLFITAGIFIAACINMGTHKYSDSAQWRVPIGINLLWGIIMFIGMLWLPESPRYLATKGRNEECLQILCNNSGLSRDDPTIVREYNEIQQDVQAELAGGPCRWPEIFGRNIRYRTFLGMAVMSFQQLTGNNYYFYYGTQVFRGTGIDSPFLAALILDAVNFVCTFGAIIVLEYFGRRWPLIIGGIWQSICFFIYAAVGDRALYRADGTSNHRAGAVMIVFSCLFIFSFAQTWAPAAYVIVGESYPIRYRSKCAGVATSSNWLWNFLISFFTPFITNSIGFKYGYVFASCNLAAAGIIFLFAKETKGLTLEEINQLYMSNVKPWQSGAYQRSRKEDVAGSEKQRIGPVQDFLEHAPNSSSGETYSSSHLPPAQTNPVGL
ncbi:hexose transporter Ght6 [Schizosaccharomyces japonicus yFS275]|uniref:Hexose transporter Ght6 n=1 Tax=Schizosaccharomyces japonicus (strain yFS275 / FY16936) TaxID=402676 RepID=B6K4P4_SCHJY|nr:hexose transporter Ght6 [Schizosaccharomyces japonicus yFS275]EEB08451.1 hexose transporter Ght6 [Schizosaccharomyces japonicus yFS275]